jgi:hypothetical protein
MAFGGQNDAYPEMDTVTLDLGTALADQTFRIRFRIGTDGGKGDTGWDIDNVAFTGIEGTPFPAEAPDDGICGTPPAEPIRSGGGCDAGRGRVGAPLVAALLALVLRRRRRR